MKRPPKSEDTDMTVKKWSVSGTLRKRKARMANKKARPKRKPDKWGWTDVWQIAFMALIIVAIVLALMHFITEGETHMGGEDVRVKVSQMSLLTNPPQKAYIFTIYIGKDRRPIATTTQSYESAERLMADVDRLKTAKDWKIVFNSEDDL